MKDGTCLAGKVAALRAMGSGLYYLLTGPIHDGVDLFHSFNCPVLFDGREKGKIGKGEIGFHFLEAHSSSRVCLFEGSMAQYSLYINNNQYVSFEEPVFSATNWSTKDEKLDELCKGLNEYM